MQVQSSTNRAKASEEYTARTISRKGEEITIIERKQQPLRIDGFDL